MGAKPVAPARKRIGRSLSCSVKRPSGPSKSSVSPTFMPSKTWVVKRPPGISRTCSSISRRRSMAAGPGRPAGWRTRSARLAPSSSTMLMYWPATKASLSSPGSVTNRRIRSGDRRSIARHAALPARRTRPPASPAASVATPSTSSSTSSSATAQHISAWPRARIAVGQRGGLVGAGVDAAVEHRAGAQAAAAGAAVVGQLEAGAQAGFEQRLAGARRRCAPAPGAA